MTFEYDLFIVHAEADESFVYGHLLPATGLAPERVMLSSALALGAIKVAELERGVQSSRFTLVVLSPALTTDRLAEFAELLASHLSGAEGRLVPLLRADCEIPPRLDFRVPLDFRDPSRWAGEGQKLRTHLQQQAASRATLAAGGVRLQREPGPSWRRRGLLTTAAMSSLLATTLILSAETRRTTCHVPGLRSLCAAVGVGDVPTLAEQALWDGALAQDGEDGLQTYLQQFPDGVYVDQARSRLAGCKTKETPGPVVEVPFDLHVSSARPLPTEEAARHDALERGHRQAGSVCEPLKEADRLLAAEAELHEWYCRPHAGGITCRADGKIICRIQKRIKSKHCRQQEGSAP